MFSVDSFSERGKSYSSPCLIALFSQTYEAKQEEEGAAEKRKRKREREKMAASGMCR